MYQHLLLFSDLLFFLHNYIIVGLLRWWNLKIVILSWKFAWILSRHVGFKTCSGQFSPTSLCPYMDMRYYEPRAIELKFKRFQIWSCYIPFKRKFNSEQLLWEYFIMKINHSWVISQNAKVTDVIFRYLTSIANICVCNSVSS